MPRKISRPQIAVRKGLLGATLALALCATVSEAGRVSGLCDAAAQRAAAMTGVPVDVMRALTRVETGRRSGDRLSPWPWAVNVEGDGHWFDTRDAALAFAVRQYKAGRHSFDVGCFQINYRWHGRAFRSIAEMFDPDANALYAAQFLSRLKAEYGSWVAAAGAYHSRTPELARRYRARYAEIHAGLAASESPAVDRSRRSSSGSAGLLPSVMEAADRMPGSLVILPRRGEDALIALN